MFHTNEPAQGFLGLAEVHNGSCAGGVGARRKKGRIVAQAALGPEL
jgi:hypothetical protein